MNAAQQILLVCFGATILMGMLMVLSPSSPTTATPLSGKMRVGRGTAAGARPEGEGLGRSDTRPEASPPNFELGTGRSPLALKEDGQAKILYLVRSFPGHYQTKLSWQLNTWMQLLDPAHDGVIVASIAQGHYRAHGLSYALPNNCSNNHGIGLCCQEAQAIATASRGNFDWLFVLDDDVYARPFIVREIAEAHPLIQASSQLPAKVALGIRGCAAKGFGGFCGGGGYLISRQAVLDLVRKPGFYAQYMANCAVTQYCDITTAHLLTQSGTALVQEERLHSWGVKGPPHEVERKIQAKEIATLHYFGGEIANRFQGFTNSSRMKMEWLHGLFNMIFPGDTPKAGPVAVSTHP